MLEWFCRLVRQKIDRSQTLRFHDNWTLPDSDGEATPPGSKAGRGGRHGQGGPRQPKDRKHDSEPGPERKKKSGAGIAANRHARGDNVIDVGVAWEGRFTFSMVLSGGVTPIGVGCSCKLHCKTAANTGCKKRLDFVDEH